MYGIRYSFPEYLCTILVAGGVSAFALAKVNILSFYKLYVELYFLVKLLILIPFYLIVS